MVIVHSTKIEGFVGCVSQECKMCPFIFMCFGFLGPM
jgi:hypothetical protein